MILTPAEDRGKNAPRFSHTLLCRSAAGHCWPLLAAASLPPRHTSHSTLPPILSTCVGNCCDLLHTHTHTHVIIYCSILMRYFFNCITVLVGANNIVLVCLAQTLSLCLHLHVHVHPVEMCRCSFKVYSSYAHFHLYIFVCL